MKTLYLTGASGYIGSALVSQLQGRDDIKIIRLGRSLSNSDQLFNLEDFKNIELTPDSVVVHLAAVLPKENYSDTKVHELNHKATVDLAKSALTSNVSHFIFVSSCAVYGPTLAVVDETTEESPEDAYGRSKLMAERSLKELAANSTTHFTVVRPASVYGNESPENHTAVSNLRSLLQRRYFPFIGKGENIKSFVHVKDVAGAIIKIIDHESYTENTWFRVFNLSRTQINVRNLVNTLKPVGQKNTTIFINLSLITFVNRMIGYIPFARIKSANVDSAVGKWTSNFEISGSSICSALGFDYQYGNVKQLELDT